MGRFKSTVWILWLDFSTTVEMTYRQLLVDRKASVAPPAGGWPMTSDEYAKRMVSIYK